MEKSSSAGTPQDQDGCAKRKRVSHACHLCRSMKSKCDGQWPECSRCRGYGYRCVYGNGKRHHRYQVAAAVTCAAEEGFYGQGDLREAIRQYEILLEDCISQLPSSKREDADQVLARMKAADRALSQAKVASSVVMPPRAGILLDLPSSRQDQLDTERFLGDVSDVRFFNLVKQVMQSHLGSTEAKQDIDSYEQDDNNLSPSLASGRIAQLPGPDKLTVFTDAYFSTIHLAFPFICQAQFKRSLDEVQAATNSTSINSTTLALIFVVCAIGAYYTSLPREPDLENKTHETYYLQALSLSLPAGTERSVDYVCLLLAQCFYLLVVCRTDSCWVTLGQTVRLAQSIGLHVEQDSTKVTAQGKLAIERRRRVWSSIYCLDRLVALQLGRPPAIHEDYCNVPRPSRLGDSDIDWDGDDLPASFTGPSTGDYHLALISFSDLLSQALRDLCNAGPGENLAEEMLKTRRLDQQLLQWKYSLPRSLRFDLGHTFEQSFIFKRQVSLYGSWSQFQSSLQCSNSDVKRSMFALKYHHLRALIHRPYLCYPVLRKMNDSVEASLGQINWTLVGIYERTCILEARETARLLHGISSKKELVEEFPWWQMISCLVFAGSILLVSSIFTENAADTLDSQEAASAYDDAETCLRAFESLRANSAAARLARDMMERLKEYGQRWREATGKTGLQGPSADSGTAGENAGLDALTFQQVPGAALASDSVSSFASDGLAHFIPTPSAWPPEMVDSMAWSIQFLERNPQREQL